MARRVSGGSAVVVGPGECAWVDVVVARDALEQMRTKVQQALSANGGATVSDLRQVLGSSRRVVVPLLEYFDRTRVTRRIGDKRVLASIR